jgi:hypothetical protein
MCEFITKKNDSMSIFTAIRQKEKLALEGFDFNIHLLSEADDILQLREAILKAIEQDEDVLLFSSNLRSLPKLPFEIIHDTIIDLVSNGIYFLFINVKCDKVIPINQNLSYINGIKQTDSFILTRPFYAIALGLIDCRDKYNCYTINQFIALINVHQFKLSENYKIELNEHKIHVVSPFRNSDPFLVEYLNSVLSQQYNNYQVHLIDDCSTDSYSLSKLLNNKVNLKVNSFRKFALQNIIETLLMNNYEDEDIICLVDADDVLLHQHAFEIVNAIYKNNSKILLTYGAMTYYNSERKNQKIGSMYKKEEFDQLRQSPWKVAHLRTFKYKLFKKLLAIDPELNNLRDESGEILKMPYDMALLFPLMELAGYTGVEFINTPLYAYRTHQNNDSAVYRNDQYYGELIVRRKKPLNSKNNF